MVAAETGEEAMKPIAKDPCPLCGCPCRRGAIACNPCYRASRVRKPYLFGVFGTLRHEARPPTPERAVRGVLLAWVIGGRVETFRCTSAEELAGLEVPAGAALWAEGEPRLLADAGVLDVPGWLSRQASRLWEGVR